ncbi:MAG: exo-alpha-sialidase [Clostridia bacterium]|nr:exo-alpha-sialidase [Clostridia bacterium]
MLEKHRKSFLLLGVLFLVSAIVLFVLLCLQPSGPRLTLCVTGNGSLTLSGDAAATLDGAGEKTLFVEAGKNLTLTCLEGVSYVVVDGVRMEQTHLRLQMTDRDLTVEAVYGEEVKAMDIYTPDVLVYEATETSQSATRPFFPSVTQADDGTILVAYYYADGHALYNQSEGKLSGVLCMVKSKNGGKSFMRPEVLVDLRDEDVTRGDFNREPRDPNLQKLSDGTLLLTFPVRAPIGKPGYNGSNLNDYWSERSYYMTSTDNGVTWSEMREIECDYFSRGEPFLYDDPTRTTGCWVKNGSVAELEGGDLLIPLYGAETCNTRADYTCVVVKAHNNGDGTLTFLKDWASVNGKKTDAALVGNAGEGNELALFAKDGTAYALKRTAIPSKTEGGVLYRSLDGGLSWQEYATEPTANNCLNQPNFCYLGGDLFLVNYSVPLASVYDSPARRTARPVYGKLFDVNGKFSDYSAVTVYDTVTATVADMGNPASVLLSDGRIFTVYYDTSAPAHRAGFIGGTFTTLSDYIGEEGPTLSAALSALLS